MQLNKFLENKKSIYNKCGIGTLDAARISSTHHPLTSSIFLYDTKHKS